jgi:hypothetical protein
VGPLHKRPIPLGALALSAIAIVVVILFVLSSWQSQHRSESLNSVQPTVISFWSDLNLTTANGAGQYSLAIDYAHPGTIAHNLQFRYAIGIGAGIAAPLIGTLYSPGGSELGLFNSTLSDWNLTTGGAYSCPYAGWVTGANATVEAGDYLLLVPPESATLVAEGFWYPGLAGGVTDSTIG